MSENGIAYLKFGGTGFTSKIQRGRIVHNLEQSSAVFTIEQNRIDTPPSWSPYTASVVCKTDAGEIIFAGEIYDDRIQRGLGKNVYEIICKDARGWMYEKSVKTTIPKDFTVSEAIQRVFALSQRTDVIDSIIGCDVQIPRISFDGGSSCGSAIKTLLNLVEDEILWWSTYNESDNLFHHTFAPMWSTHLGSLTHILIDGNGICDDRTNMKNVVICRGKDVEFARPHRQYWFFEEMKTETTWYDPAKATLKIPLEHKPNGLRLFLMVGKVESDPAAYLNASLQEMKLLPASDSDQSALNFDIDLHLPKSAYIVPSSIMGTQIAKTSFNQVPIRNTPTEDVTGSVIRKIQGYYTLDWSCKYQSQADPEIPGSDYGIIYAPAPEKIRARIKSFNSANGLNIEPGNVLGYVLIYTVRGDVTKEYKDLTSIAAYKERLAQTIDLPTSSRTMMNLFGKAQVKAFAKIPKSGNVKSRIYVKGVRDCTILPLPGRVVDYKDSFRGDVDDFEVRSVTFDINSQQFLASVDGGVFSNAFQDVANALKARMQAQSSVSNELATTDLEVSDEAEFTDTEPSYTQIDEEDACKPDGQSTLLLFVL